MGGIRNLDDGEHLAAARQREDEIRQVVEGEDTAEPDVQVDPEETGAEQRTTES